MMPSAAYWSLTCKVSQRTAAFCGFGGVGEDRFRVLCRSPVIGFYQRWSRNDLVAPRGPRFRHRHDGSLAVELPCEIKTGGQCLRRGFRPIGRDEDMLVHIGFPGGVRKSLRLSDESCGWGALTQVKQRAACSLLRTAACSYFAELSAMPVPAATGPNGRASENPIAGASNTTPSVPWSLHLTMSRDLIGNPQQAAEGFCFSNRRQSPFQPHEHLLRYKSRRGYERRL